MQLTAQHLAEIVEVARKNDAGTAKDKRRYVRHPVVCRVEILSHTQGLTYATLIRDISVEGLGLLLSLPLARGELFSVALPRIGSTPLLAQCTVLHSREVAQGIWGIGAAFVSTTPAKPQNATSNAEARRIAAKMLD